MKNRNLKIPSREEWAKSRYKLFNEKIDSFRYHPRYEWLRKYADDAIFYNEGSGYAMIAAADFIERIEMATIGFIADWLAHQNQLEWKTINVETNMGFHGRLASPEEDFCFNVVDNPNSKIAQQSGFLCHFEASADSLDSDCPGFLLYGSDENCINAHNELFASLHCGNYLLMQANYFQSDMCGNAEKSEHDHIENNQVRSMKIRVDTSEYTFMTELFFDDKEHAYECHCFRSDMLNRFIWEAKNHA